MDAIVISGIICVCVTHTSTFRINKVERHGRKMASEDGGALFRRFKSSSSFEVDGREWGHRGRETTRRKDDEEAERHLWQI